MLVCEFCKRDRCPTGRGCRAVATDILLDTSHHKSAADARAYVRERVEHLERLLAKRIISEDGPRGLDIRYWRGVYAAITSAHPLEVMGRGVAPYTLRDVRKTGSCDACNAKRSHGTRGYQLRFKTYSPHNNTRARIGLCPACDRAFMYCGECDGTGKVSIAKRPADREGPSDDRLTCNECDGAGRLFEPDPRSLAYDLP